jgi:molybdopterin-guanine dinucleotide biosynthesis protein A
MSRSESLQAVVLTGGESKRMGTDKAALMATGVVSVFSSLGIPVTVLGREPIDGLAFLRDESEFAGPATALSKFDPSSDLVFVCSCDLPLFRRECVSVIAGAIGDKEAAIPVVDGRGQYLCAAYRASVFAEWRHQVESDGLRSMRELVRVLDAAFLDETALCSAGVEPEWVLGVNTPDELRKALDT